jgi:hypothetical protein
MKKMMMILVLFLFVFLFEVNAAFSAPKLKGDWIPFATVEGKYVGQPEELKVYYDADSLMVKPTFASCRIWVDDPQSFFKGHVDYVMFTKQYGVWMYQAESNRQALSYKYNRLTNKYDVASSNIPPERIAKGSVADKLFSTLYSANGEIRKEIVKYLERNEKRNEEIRRKNSAEEVRRRALLREEEEKQRNEIEREEKRKKEEALENAKLEAERIARTRARVEQVVSTPPVQDKKIVTVTWTSAIIRSGVGNDYPVVTSVNQGDKLTVIGESGEWLNVQLENNKQGWISSRVVK